MYFSKKLLCNIVFCFSLFNVGCTWQKIPDTPNSTHVTQIPVTVGIVLSKSQASGIYGPRIVEEWNQSNLFQKIIYPYRTDDVVDAVLELDVTGKWKGSGAGAGFVIGLTFGIASPFIGPSLTGNHALNILSTLNDKTTRKYSVTAKTKVSWGIAGDANEVGAKADNLQVKKLAIAGAEKLMQDKDSFTQ